MSIQNKYKIITFTKTYVLIFALCSRIITSVTKCIINDFHQECDWWTLSTAQHTMFTNNMITVDHEQCDQWTSLGMHLMNFTDTVIGETALKKVWLTTFANSLIGVFDKQCDQWNDIAKTWLTIFANSVIIDFHKQDDFDEKSNITGFFIHCNICSWSIHLEFALRLHFPGAFELSSSMGASLLECVCFEGKSPMFWSGFTIFTESSSWHNIIKSCFFCQITERRGFVSLLHFFMLNISEAGIPFGKSMRQLNESQMTLQVTGPQLFVLACQHMWSAFHNWQDLHKFESWVWDPPVKGVSKFGVAMCSLWWLLLTGSWVGVPGATAVEAVWFLSTTVVHDDWQTHWAIHQSPWFVSWECQHTTQHSDFCGHKWNQPRFAFWNWTCSCTRTPC